MYCYSPSKIPFSGNTQGGTGSKYLLLQSLIFDYKKNDIGYPIHCITPSKKTTDIYVMQ